MLASLLPAPPEEQCATLVAIQQLNDESDAFNSLRHYGSLEQGYHVTNAPKRPFILVVDDDHFIGELLAELLADVGFRVEVVFNGQDAYTVACNEAPALILTDFMMPDCDGERLAHQVRNNPKTRMVPLALMSSARPRLSSLNGIPFLPKPFDIDDVLAFVNRYVASTYPCGEG